MNVSTSESEAVLTQFLRMYVSGESGVARAVFCLRRGWPGWSPDRASDNVARAAFGGESGAAIVPPGGLRAEVVDIRTAPARAEAARVLATPMVEVLQPAGVDVAGGGGAEGNGGRSGLNGGGGAAEVAAGPEGLLGPGLVVVRRFVGGLEDPARLRAAVDRVYANVVGPRG